MTSKFVGFLESVGRFFTKALPWVETTGEVAVSAFFPAMGPLFNKTVNVVVTAEQTAAAVGKQSGTGLQKSASVVQLMGPLIAQALADAGKPNDDAAVQNYINSVVTILNTTPPPPAT